MAIIAREYIGFSDISRFRHQELNPIMILSELCNTKVLAAETFMEKIEATFCAKYESENLELPSISARFFHNFF